MGRYLNPVTAGFEMSRNSEIYIDKTGMITEMNKLVNTEQRFVCISRPRRFGKTMALNMLSAYYDRTKDSFELFTGLKIAADEEAFRSHANKYDVLRIDMAKLWSGRANIDAMLAELNKAIMYDIIQEYPDIEYYNSSSLIDSMTDVFLKTGRKFVILIDEWDIIFREAQQDKEGQKQYLDFLRSWLKNQDFVALCYMTGILPIKKYGKHSALNMFTEYSMENPGRLASYVGFTEANVRGLCQEFDMDYAECSSWYDGYTFVQENRIYNPLSVVRAMLSHAFGNYWNQTETYEALKIYIQMNYDGLQDKIINLLSGNSYKIDISHYSNDMTDFNSADDVLTLLIHLGYLGYDSSRKEVFIPNNEIRSEFSTSVRASDRFTEVAKAIKHSDELLQATLAGDAKRVAELVGAAHTEMSHLQYNDENALSYAISLAYYTARNKYTVVRELPTGNGFADLVFIPRPFCQELPALVVELKWNRSTKTAIQQIKKKNYIAGLQDYVGRILLVGVNYSKQTRKHTCRIEKA